MGEGKENMLYSVLFRISLRSSTVQSLRVRYRLDPLPSVTDNVLVGGGDGAVELSSRDKGHNEKAYRNKKVCVSI